MKRKLLLALAALFTTAVALMGAEEWKLPADESKLKSAPGADLVTANCQICHSADYISTQPPMNRATWSAAVQKMREKYGAPLPPDRANAIVEYLVKNYGKP
ncbi:MAG TPA: cytochrome c [Verrucomicrobiae bacterium]|jgi:mono/diheme cytochrome c family protein|nr:cytochrome c [Verrucomicrobiae bacterium]